MILKSWLTWGAAIGFLLAVMTSTVSLTVKYLEVMDAFSSSRELSEENKEVISTLREQAKGLNAKLDRICRKTKGCK